MKQGSLSMTGYFDTGKKTRREQFLADDYAWKRTTLRFQSTSRAARRTVNSPANSPVAA